MTTGAALELLLPIVDRKDGGFDLQHREKRGWQAVKEFPWTACEAPKPAR